VKPLLSTAAAQIQLLDYFSYTALTVAALYDEASADEQNTWRELLTAHREQLREWTENYTDFRRQACTCVGRDRPPRGAGRRRNAFV
jgi:hypothetical protein